MYFYIRRPHFFFLFFFHVLCLCATLWVMTDLLSVLYVHFPAWRKAPYFSTISALSRHTLSVAFRRPHCNTHRRGNMENR